MRRIRLAIVDDSTFVRKALCRILEREPSIRVMGAAASGEELLENLGKWRPEVITLDLSMPGIGGLATLDRVLAWKPIPVIILSTHSSKDAPLTIEALHRGAVDFIDKQKYSLVDFDSLRKVLVEKVLQVVGEGDPAAQERSAAVKPSPAPRRPEPPAAPVQGAPVDLVLIGASTGGPPAIQQILQGLAVPLPVPVVMVQHMPEGFTEAFARRLDQHLPFEVREAVHGETLRAGTVYLAAAGAHLQLELVGDRLEAVCTKHPADATHRPSVDVLFQSVARFTDGDFRPVAVLLTGMGKDGAVGMAELARRGVLTLAQDQSSCVVWGMPRAAKECGAVREELPLGAIAGRLNRVLGRGSKR